VINLGDIIRPIVRFFDGLWIRLMGRKVCLHKSGIAFRAMYTIPHSTPQMFGIDTPDEVEVEADLSQVLGQLGKPPELGDVILLNDGCVESYRIVSRSYRDRGGWLGRSNRLVLVCTRYVECKSVTKEPLYVEDKV